MMLFLKSLLLLMMMLLLFMMMLLWWHQVLKKMTAESKSKQQSPAVDDRSAACHDTAALKDVAIFEYFRYWKRKRWHPKAKASNKADCNSQRNLSSWSSRGFSSASWLQSNYFLTFFLTHGWHLVNDMMQLSALQAGCKVKFFTLFLSHFGHLVDDDDTVFFSASFKLQCSFKLA